MPADLPIMVHRGAVIGPFLPRFLMSYSWQPGLFSLLAGSTSFVRIVNFGEVTWSTRPNSPVKEQVLYSCGLTFGPLVAGTH